MMRHGEAENNVKHILAGRELEYYLTERGREQVASTAEGLKSVPIEAIYTSPVTRTVETAKIVSETIGIDYTIDDRLIETDMGSIVGMSYNEALEKFGNIFLRFYHDDPMLRNLHVERFSSIRARINNILDFVADKHQATNVLLVTHLDPIKAAINRIFNLNPDTLFNMTVKNASLTILRHGSSDYNLIAFNVMNMNRYPLEQ
jgi:probable phosphoglycerate mutase